MLNNTSVIIAHVPYEIRGGEDIHVELLIDAYCRIGFTPILFPIDRRPPGSRLWDAAKSLSLSESMQEFEQLWTNSGASYVHLHNIYPILGPRFLRHLASRKIPTVMTVHNHRFYCTNGLALREGKICKDCKASPVAWRAVTRNCNGDIKKSVYYAAAITESRASNLLQKAVTRFVAPSPYIKNELISFGISSDKISVIVNPTATNPQAVSSTLDFACDVFYAGRLSQEKGILPLLATIEKIPELRIAIAGGGPLEKDVKNAAARLKNLTYFGALSHEDVLQTIRNAKVTVLPSICNEILPTFVLESLSLGKRAIVPDLDSTRWLANEEFGAILCQPGNADDLARAIREAVKKPVLTDVTAALLKKKFGIERFCGELLELANSIL